MDTESLEQLEKQVGMAYELASSGHLKAAVHLFAAARDFASREVDQSKLDAEIMRQQQAYTKEREFYRNEIREVTAGHEGKPSLVIFSDSLGLPRPTAKDTPRKGAEHLYANLMGEFGRHVDPICQRFFTTNEIVQILEREQTLGFESDVLIHVGLNDTARRMFLERHRLAMQFLPAETRGRIVGFSQKFRKEILKWLPPLYYTPLEQFIFNLNEICKTLKARDARRIVLTTIVLPPQRFWHATPHMDYYFDLYNMAILAAAERHDVISFNFDRHAWSNLHREPLDPDGMHLSPFGHKLFAEELEKLL